MKIEGIRVRNVYGARYIDVRCSTPITIFAGGNQQGKTSIYNAIRMAVGGATILAPYKRDNPSLVTEGQKSGDVVVTFTGGEGCSISLPDAKTGAVPVRAHELGLLLNMDGFVSMSEKDRLQFLLQITGTKFTPDAMAERMIKRRDCAPELVEIIKPLLTSPSTAETRADKYCTEYRGSWKAVTGETYGAVKGASWAPKVEALSQAEAEELHRIDARLDELDLDLSAAQKRLGAVEERNRAASTYDDRVAQAQREVERLTEFDGSHKIWVDTAKQLNDDLAAVQRRLPEARPDNLMACKSCGQLHEMQGGELFAWNDVAVANPSTQQEVDELMQEVKDAEKNVQRFGALQQALNDARATLADLKANHPGEPKLTMPIEASIQTLRTTMDGLRKQRDELQERERAASAADDQKAKALHFHRLIEGWQRIREAVGPEGVATEMMREVLQPMNEKLRDYAITSGWRQITIEPDMSLTSEGRPWRLLSKSMQWRGMAMLGVMLADVTGLRVIALDEFDVLEPAARTGAVMWFAEMAGQGVLESVLLFATLRERPKRTPDDVRLHWIVNGEIEEPKQESEATA